MAGVLIALLLLSTLFGKTKGLLGGLVGAFLGALVLTGMASTAADGALPALYTPGELLSAAVPVAVVAAVLAVVAPYATGFAALGWAAGATLAAFATARTDQAMYVLPLLIHLLAAAAIVHLARQRATAVGSANGRAAARALASSCLASR